MQKNDEIVLRFSGGWGLLSPLVSWYTKSPYTHVDIVFPEGYCSSMPFKGVKVFRREYIKPKTEKFVTVKCDRSAIIRLARNQIGKGYDWGVWIFHILNVNIKRSDCWTCSGFVASILNIGDRNTTPAELYRKLK